MVVPKPDSTPGSHGVTNFYGKRNILITGATGFLGKLVTAKLLRVCRDINSFFFILRAKKGRSSKTRFEELVDDIVFDELKKENPECFRKVVLIEGDMRQIGLGLSPEHRKLIQTTHIILHVAATGRFTESIRYAARVNVRGTKELVSLTMEMPDLKGKCAYNQVFIQHLSEKGLGNIPALTNTEEKYYKFLAEMSQAAYIQDMMADPVLDVTAGPHEVANFFAHRNVLLTGGFGFLGRLLAERILRSCSNINMLFLVLRAKRGKSSQERFAELFDDALFDRLKRERPEFARKVVLVEGDMTKVGLDLSSQDRELLRTSDIVIHGAATVRFDDKLRTAATTNIGGTKELLSLAEEMPNLKAFVHISTAYSNCVHELIEEKFYPPPMKTEKLLSLMEILDDAALDHVTPLLLGEWPNTYAYTKAITEDAIRQNGRNLPLCIVRPSIVISTAKEPVSGWVNNLYGAIGILVGAAVGLLRTLHCDPDLVADLIPADYVVNVVLAAAWDIAKSRTLNSNNAESSLISKTEEPPIYNVVSSCQKPLTWGHLLKYSSQSGLKIPSMMCMWYFCFTLNKHRWIHELSVIFLHLIPAAIADSLAWLSGRKPILLEAYRKIHKFSSVISYFTLRQWRFQNNEVIRLWKSLSPADQAEFDLNIGTLDWEDFFNHNMRGIRVYLLKDPLETAEKARVRYRRLKVAHYTLMTSCFLVIVWLLRTILRFIGSCLFASG